MACNNLSANQTSVKRKAYWNWWCVHLWSILSWHCRIVIEKLGNPLECNIRESFVLFWGLDQPKGKIKKEKKKKKDKNKEA